MTARSRPFPKSMLILMRLPEQLNSLVTANQSANTTDIENLIALVTTFQSSLTSEELAALYPERMEFAAQPLMLLDER